MEERSIKSFVFDSAAYKVSDGADSALLRIDYRRNTFVIESDQPLTSGAFLARLKEVAVDLLRRKHGINFVDRIER